MLERAGLGGAEADVGGQAALAAQARSVSDADLFRLAPLVLASAFVLLALLLRTPVALLYLLGTTVLSFAATLGATTVLFQTVLGHGGVVYYVSFTLFILLVALGSDYNIFIMAAIREEAKEKPLPEAVAAALAGTRGTINAARPRPRRLLRPARAHSLAGLLPDRRRGGARHPPRRLRHKVAAGAGAGAARRQDRLLAREGAVLMWSPDHGYGAEPSVTSASSLPVGLSPGMGSRAWPRVL